MKNLCLLTLLFAGLGMNQAVYGQEIETQKVAFSVYPNPTISILNTSLTDFQYAIYDYTGTMVSYGWADEPRVDVSELNKGVYWIRVLGNEGEMGAHRFVKE